MLRGVNRVIKRTRIELEKLMQKEEEFWHIRSHTNWLKQGDRNTKYFHHHASQRKRKNHIEGLLDNSGVLRYEENEMENIVVDYYSQLFKATTP